MLSGEVVARWAPVFSVAALAEGVKRSPFAASAFWGAAGLCAAAAFCGAAVLVAVRAWEAWDDRDRDGALDRAGRAGGREGLLFLTGALTARD